MGKHNNEVDSTFILIDQLTDAGILLIKIFLRRDQNYNSFSYIHYCLIFLLKQELLCF